MLAGLQLFAITGRLQHRFVQRCGQETSGTTDDDDSSPSSSRIACRSPAKLCVLCLTSTWKPCTALQQRRALDVPWRLALVVARLTGCCRDAKSRSLRILKLSFQMADSVI
jgi:hypothetical protein